jgi:uncharacterized protein YbbK (DUF523 family)
MGKATGKHKILVGVSSCLLGESVRFDGGHRYNYHVVEILSEYFQYRSFCPEMDIGLGTPREPVHLIGNDAGIHCIGATNPSLDVTDKLINSADRQSSWHDKICGYIFKKGSPSCGVKKIKVRRGHNSEADGTGIYAARVLCNYPDLPVIEENELSDGSWRENFVQHVSIYHHWQKLLANNLTMDRLAVRSVPRYLDRSLRSCFHLNYAASLSSSTIPYI